MRLATGRTVLQVALKYAFPFPCSCAVRLADLPQQMCVCIDDVTTWSLFFAAANQVGTRPLQLPENEERTRCPRR